MEDVFWSQFSSLHIDKVGRGKLASGVTASALYTL